VSGGPGGQAANQGQVSPHPKMHAVRVVRAYRTVSHAAATVLAGWPPLEFLAAMHAEIYQHEREILEATGRKAPARAKKIIRIHA